MADIDRLIGFMAIMQVPFMNDPDALAYIEEVKTVLKQAKSQQPRVMTLDEVKASKGADMYLEISTRTDEIPYITAATLDGVGTKGVAFYCSHYDFVAYNRRLYGWRCWTPARPTDAQREAEPWE